MWLLVKLQGEGRLYVNLDNVKFISPTKEGASVVFMDGTERTVVTSFDDLKNQIDNVRNFMRGA